MLRSQVFRWLSMTTVLVVALIGCDRQISGHGARLSGTELGPVLIVPGYGGATASLDPLANALRHDGRTVVIVHLPGDGKGDLRAQAEVLASAVNRARAGAHSGPADVIGYSAGGIVARIWVRDLGGTSAARRIVMLGAPNHGTRLAELAQYLLPFECPSACQQLAPGSSVLKHLNSRDDTPVGPRYVSIWTTADRVVVPANSARLDGAVNLSVEDLCPADHPSHEDLPTDRVVINVVRREIGLKPVATLSSRDCPQLSS